MPVPDRRAVRYLPRQADGLPRAFLLRRCQVRGRCPTRLHIRPASYSTGDPRRRKAVMPGIPDGPAGCRYRLRGFLEAAAGVVAEYLRLSFIDTIPTLIYNHPMP